MHVLDNPAWSALNGPQRHVAETAGPVARFHPAISLFGAFDQEPGPDHWAAMARLIGPGGTVITTGCTATPPDGWIVEFDGEAVQMTAEQLLAERRAVRPDGPDGPDGPDVLPLGADDVDDMLELVALTRPGPFTSRTYELGGYVGVRHQGRLIAMAGERMRPVGWGEISAVATHPDHRGQGLAERLVRVVVSRIFDRGDAPLLHTSTDNANAIRLYEAMGFTIRRETRFLATRAPAAAASVAADSLKSADSLKPADSLKSGR